MLTSRITATSNAVFTAENMFVWNVLPPCAAMIGAIALVTTVSVPMALTLSVIGGVVVVAMFHMAAAGKPLHHEFADKSAAVDGEMVDVIGNMSLVRAFCGLSARASPLRHDGRSRSDRAPAQPALSRTAAPDARSGHRGADHRPAGLGDPALAERQDLHRRRRARLHARALGAARHARPRSRARRRHAASGAALRGIVHAAGPARSARSSGGDAAVAARRTSSA